VSCACQFMMTTAVPIHYSQFCLLKLAACSILSVANAAPAPGPMLGPASAPTGYAPGAPHYNTVPAVADCLSYHVCYILIIISALISPFTVGIMHALFAVLQGTQQTSRDAAMYLLCIMLSWQLFQLCSILIDACCLD